jgi:hypothetical protein
LLEQLLSRSRRTQPRIERVNLNSEFLNFSRRVFAHREYGIRAAAPRGRVH